jgi:phage terminase large subunit
VQTFWDLGLRDATSIVFAQLSHGNRSINIIDYVEMTGEAFPYYADLLKQKAEQFGYSYEGHTAPHDINVAEWNGKTRIETARGLGITFKPPPGKVPLEEGINAVKMTLPKCYIDRVKCQRLLESMRYYHRVYDPKNMVFRSTPQHDWSSHAEAAMRTLSLSVRNYEPPIEQENYSRPNAAAGSWMG